MTRARDDHPDLGAYVDGLTATTASSSRRNRSVDAALLFVDVSGYTALTERLAALGRVGSETLTDIVNTCFERLIDDVFAADGHVLRFGGDALFIAFVGPERLERAAETALAMQRTIRGLPAIQAPGGRVRLSQSIGLHRGDLLLHRWSGSWTEVVPYGPAVTEVLRCEAAAHAGQTAISDTVVADLGAARVRRRADGVALLRATSRPKPERTPSAPNDDAGWKLRCSVGPQVLAPSVRNAVRLASNLHIGRLQSGSLRSPGSTAWRAIPLRSSAPPTRCSPPLMRHRARWM